MKRDTKPVNTGQLFSNELKQKEFTNDTETSCLQGKHRSVWRLMRFLGLQLDQVAFNMIHSHLVCSDFLGLDARAQSKTNGIPYILFNIWLLPAGVSLGDGENLSGK